MKLLGISKMIFVPGIVLQEAAEVYWVFLFEDTNVYAIHVKCITIRPRDM